MSWALMKSLTIPAGVSEHTAFETALVLLVAVLRQGGSPFVVLSDAQYNFLF
jgi:hypothetical protein